MTSGNNTMGAPNLHHQPGSSYSLAGEWFCAASQEREQRGLSLRDRDPADNKS